jgi:hypothetical protein
MRCNADRLTVADERVDMVGKAGVDVGSLTGRRWVFRGR